MNVKMGKCAWLHCLALSASDLVGTWEGKVGVWSDGSASPFLSAEECSSELELEIEMRSWDTLCCFKQPFPELM